MMRCQGDKLYATVTKQRVGTHQECIDPLLRKARKDRVNVAIGAGIEDIDLHTNGKPPCAGFR